MGSAVRSGCIWCCVALFDRVMVWVCAQWLNGSGRFRRFGFVAVGFGVWWAGSSERVAFVACGERKGLLWVV